MKGWMVGIVVKTPASNGQTWRRVTKGERGGERLSVSVSCTLAKLTTERRKDRRTERDVTDDSNAAEGNCEERCA